MRAKRIIGTIALLGAAVVIAHTMSGNAKTQLDMNKETVTNFYKVAFNDHKPAAAVEKYVGGSYIQHNPMVADGSLPFIDFVNGYAQKFPHLKVDIKRVIAEGDFVVTHVLITTDEKDRGTVAMDIFRLEGGKIVEHWDVVQPMPEKSANENGMF